ncbi:MAG: tyrosine-type recombinase/integrase [Proteobacteria bacterium]|nr:tyrosine-type recombinase/integrase [Pseudomonadota bacterium]
MGVYLHHGKWYIDYYYQGKRLRESAGTNKRQALKALSARSGDIVHGKFRIEEVKPTPYFEDFSKQYLEWAKDNHKAWKSMDAVRIRALLTFFKGKRLHQIIPFLIEGYKSLRKDKVKPATINRELTVLSSIFSRAVDWGLLTDHPMKGGKVKKLKEDSLKERILSVDEERSLLEKAQPWIRDRIIVALDTGMRLGEILSLTWDQIDLSGKIISVKHTKTGKERRVLVTERVYRTLISRKEENPQGAMVFPSVKGNSTSRAHTAFKRACDKAGILGLRFHDLRHTCATRLVIGGVDIATVKKILGHSTIRTTERYLHPSSEEDKKAVRVLESVVESSHHMDTKKEIGLKIIPLTT